MALLSGLTDVGSRGNFHIFLMAQIFTAKLNTPNIGLLMFIHIVDFLLAFLILTRNKNSNTQWFPMCQFGFENYDTQIRVKIQNLDEVNHLQVFSSYCPKFQPFCSHFCVFDQ